MPFPRFPLPQVAPPPVELTGAVTGAVGVGLGVGGAVGVGVGVGTVGVGVEVEAAPVLLPQPLQVT